MQRLSDKVQLKSGEYAINTDFRVWMEIERLFFEDEHSMAVRLAKVFALAYPALPLDPQEAIWGIMWFYSGGEDPQKEAEREGQAVPPCFDLTEDFDYIWGGFMGQYGIDLTRDTMHWWKFKTLLACLDEECKFSKIVAFRSMDTAKVRDKELRRYYEKMKKHYRLKNVRSSQLGEAAVVAGLEGLF